MIRKNYGLMSEEEARALLEGRDLYLVASTDYKNLANSIIEPNNYLPVKHVRLRMPDEEGETDAFEINAKNVSNIMNYTISPETYNKVINSDSKFILFVVEFINTYDLSLVIVPQTFSIPASFFEPFAAYIGPKSDYLIEPNKSYTYFGSLDIKEEVAGLIRRVNTDIRHFVDYLRETLREIEISANTRLFSVVFYWYQNSNKFEVYYQFAGLNKIFEKISQKRRVKINHSDNFNDSLAEFFEPKLVKIIKGKIRTYLNRSMKSDEIGNVYSISIGRPDSLQLRPEMFELLQKLDNRINRSRTGFTIENSVTEEIERKFINYMKMYREDYSKTRPMTLRTFRGRYTRQSILNGLQNAVFSSISGYTDSLGRRHGFTKSYPAPYTDLLNQYSLLHNRNPDFIMKLVVKNFNDMREHFYNYIKDISESEQEFYAFMSSSDALHFTSNVNKPQRKNEFIVSLESADSRQQFRLEVIMKFNLEFEEDAIFVEDVNVDYYVNKSNARKFTIDINDEDLYLAVRNTLRRVLVTENFQYDNRNFGTSQTEKGGYYRSLQLVGDNLNRVVGANDNVYEITPFKVDNLTGSIRGIYFIVHNIINEVDEIRVLGSYYTADSRKTGGRTTRRNQGTTAIFSYCTGFIEMLFTKAYDGDFYSNNIEIEGSVCSNTNPPMSVLTANLDYLSQLGMAMPSENTSVRQKLDEVFVRAPIHSTREFAIYFAGSILNKIFSSIDSGDLKFTFNKIEDGNYIFNLYRDGNMIVRLKISQQYFMRGLGPMTNDDYEFYERFEPSNYREFIEIFEEGFLRQFNSEIGTVIENLPNGLEVVNDYLNNSSAKERLARRILQETLIGADLAGNEPRRRLE